MKNFRPGTQIWARSWSGKWWPAEVVECDIFVVVVRWIGEGTTERVFNANTRTPDEHASALLIQ